MKKNKFWRFALQRTQSPLEALKLVLFARGVSRGNPAQQATDFPIELEGRKVTVSLREHTTDVGSFIEVFLDQLYALPTDFNPKVILDVGGNIGMVSLYFSLKYPNAQIHTFEPIESNLTLLRKNIESNQLKNVTIHPYGLGDHDEVLTFSAPSAGTCWAYTSGKLTGDVVTVKAPIRSINAVWDELHLEHVDLAKIDCEGAELDIFRSLGQRMNQISLLMGELHPNVCNATEALYLLSQTHHIDYQKAFNDQAFAFRASLEPWKI